MKAVIFDMDGVLSDTQVLCANIESELLRDYGIHISPGYISDSYSGVQEHVWIKEESAKHGKALTDDDIREFSEKKWSMLMSHEALPIAGSQDLVRNVRSAGYLTAIASSSRRAYIDKVVGDLDIKEYIGVIVSSQDVKKGKPAPDIFLLAADKLGAHPSDCIVIEDGINGMLGARYARMRCIGLVPVIDYSRYPANYLVTSLPDAFEILKNK